MTTFSREVTAWEERRNKACRKVVWHVTADACQRTVVAGPAEGTALGNILVQAIATGHLPDLATARQAAAASVLQQVYTPQTPVHWMEIENYNSSQIR